MSASIELLRRELHGYYAPLRHRILQEKKPDQVGQEENLSVRARITAELEAFRAEHPNAHP